MAVRIRKDGRVLCAAMHPAESGDIYVPDEVNYYLSAVAHVLVTDINHDYHGEWWWVTDLPDGVKPDLWWVSVPG